MHVRAAVAVLLVTGSCAGLAFAAAPRGNANYIAQDSKGRPGITLWMQTKTRMMIFACYHWGPGPRHGDHLNNSYPIKVSRTGVFRYDGNAQNLEGKIVHMQLSGRFITRDVARGTLTTTCARHQHFTARYSSR